jgi:tetratricopeptide (TPR) repeat protein
LALQREPYNAKAAFNLGNVLDELNSTEEAVQWYERSVEADPRFPDVYFNLATAFEKLGLGDRALRNWRAYLQFDSESQHASVAKRRVKVLEQHFAD